MGPKSRFQSFVKPIGENPMKEENIQNFVDSNLDRESWIFYLYVSRSIEIFEQDREYYEALLRSWKECKKQFTGI